ncbi:hypothetical protein D3C84_1031700 [compost metagenome]
MHRSVVIPRRHAFDVVAAIIGFDRAFRAKHHARRHGRLAAGMADVVALHTLWWFVQVQHFCQCIETCRDVLTISQACAQRLLGIGDR